MVIRRKRLKDLKRKITLSDCLLNHEYSFTRKNAFKIATRKGFLLEYNLFGFLRKSILLWNFKQFQYNEPFLLKKKKHDGFIYITITKNNIFSCITNSEGDVLLNISSGDLKAKGKFFKVSMPVAETMGMNLCERLFFSIKRKYLFLGVRFYNSFNNVKIASSLVESFHNKGVFHIVFIEGIQKVAHNGCRLKRAKRK